MERLSHYTNNLRFIILFLLLSISIWGFLESRKSPVRFLDREGIEQTLMLPKRDKRLLTEFMEKLFIEDTFAYSILGDKPVSWATFQNPFPYVDWATFRSSLTKYNRVMRKGWKTWAKYQHHFPEGALTIEYPQCYVGSASILHINHERFTQVVDFYKEDFAQVLSREIKGPQLIKEAKNCSLMNDILKGHQALLGIVLGYGRNNSWQFLEKAKVHQPLGCVWGETNEEYTYEEKPTNMTSAEYYMSIYSFPRFAGDPNSEESLALKSHYMQTRDKVLDYYKGKDFLEASLSLLAQQRAKEYVIFD